MKILPKSRDDSKYIIIFKAVILCNNKIYIEKYYMCIFFLEMSYDFSFYFSRTHSKTVMFSNIPY